MNAVDLHVSRSNASRATRLSSILGRVQRLRLSGHRAGLAALALAFASPLLALADGIGEAQSAAFALYLGPGFGLPAGSNVGEATSAAFTLDLGSPVLPPGGGVGSSLSSQFALFLGSGFVAPSGAAIGSANSPAFALNLDLLSDGFAISGPFILDTRSIPRLTVPNGGVTWTPGAHAITWDLTGAPPAYWTVYYSTDGGQGYQIVKDHLVSQQPFGTSWNVPPIGSAHLRIRVVGRDGNGTALCTDDSDQDNLLYNPSGVALEYKRPSSAVSESRAVIVWDDLSVTRYTVEVKQDNESACAADPVFPKTYTIIPMHGLIAPNYLEIPSPEWENMVPSFWTAKIKAFVGAGHQVGDDQQCSFVKCRLGDLDPMDTEQKSPVILVHGWFDDSGTWFENGQNPFKDGLVHGTSTQDRRHPWTFEYPNIESIRYSAAGLGDALGYIEHLSGTDSVMLAAHSMGGLVCRTYLQNQAIKPANEEAYPQFRGDVTRLVTLGTPNLGEPHTGSAAFVNNIPLFGGCEGLRRSQSTKDLDEKSILVHDLALTPLPSTVQYLFAAGTNPIGEPHGGFRHGVGENICAYGNDATVDVCSARGGDCPGLHRNTQLNVGAAMVTRRNYFLSHMKLCNPGFPWPTQGQSTRERDESTALLTDVLAFLRTGIVSNQQCPANDPYEVEVKLRRHERPSTKAGDPIQPSLGRRIKNVAVGRSATLTDLVDLPVPGAEVFIQTSEAADSIDGVTLRTNRNGTAVIEMPAGEYFIRTRSQGNQMRQDHLLLGSTASTVHWTMDLHPDVLYDGPRNPIIEINAGAMTTVDSTVSLTLACDDAVEYKIGEATDFPTAQWQPLIPARTMILTGGPGPKIVVAQFRDTEGRESTLVDASIVVIASSWGALNVTSSSPGASILLNGRDTGKVTPAVLDTLAPGFYYVALGAPGRISMPEVVVARVDSGLTAPVTFGTRSSAPPESVDLSTLGAGPFFPPGPLHWTAAADPDSEDIVFYDVLVSRDSLGTEGVWQRTGLLDTNAEPNPSLPDSLSYYISVRAVDSHGTFQNAIGSRRLLLDRTPPRVHIVAPASKDTLQTGSNAALMSEVSDWGQVGRVTATLSFDNGQSFPDTVYDGTWATSVEWTVPAHIYSNRCKIKLTAYDRAGNVGFDISDSSFAIVGEVSDVVDGGPPRLSAFDMPRANPFNAHTSLD